jgi:hypothetical protein
MEITPRLANIIRIKEIRLDFRFPLVPYSVYMKRATSVCLLQRKTETANFRLFAVNGNGKRKFVLVGQQTINGNRQCVSANVPICGYNQLQLLLALVSPFQC